MNPYLEKVVSLANQNKYTKYYSRIIENALKRPQDRKFLKSVFGYVESHHILPESFGLGGEKDKENLVFLTAKEHFIVHLCATKMFESIFKNKMVFAFRQLKSSNKYQGERYMNSRLYSLVKPNFKLFVRLYMGESVKYLYENQVEEILNLEANGWSREMTREFKQKYVKGMIGKKHSEQAKKNMSKAQKGIPKLKLRGQKHSKERIEKVLNSKKKFWDENPEKYREYLQNLSARSKEFHASGVIDLKGEKNGMFGKEHSISARKKISEAQKRSHRALKSDPEKYQEWIESRKKIGKKIWENQDLRDRCKIIFSKAYQKHGIHPKEYYEQKLKPLLYLGFLPTAIVKYKLLDIHAGSIKLWIKRYGSTEDMQQFELNKKNGAGANKAYIKFQEEQYLKYFASEREKIDGINIPIHK